MLVSDAGQLREICDQLREAGRFAFDTEFVQERTYYVDLGIVQVAAPGVEAVIDPIALKDISPLEELLFDPEVEKIVHAGRQDFQIFYERCGKPPANIFDAQVAAAFVGCGAQISYMNLVEKVTGTRLKKHQTLTDWTKRPLTADQVEYALDDVRFLEEVYQYLMKHLEEMGREGWAREEMKPMETLELYKVPPPEEFYYKYRSADMSSKVLGVLQALAEWRERLAMERNIPRGRIIRDDLMVDIARRQPKNAKALTSTRLIRQRLSDSQIAELLRIVETGLEEPLPKRLKSRKPPKNTDTLARMCDVWVRSRADSAQIAPVMLAKKADLTALCAGFLQGELPDSQLLTGWRRELVGQDLIDLMEGNLFLGLDAEQGEVVAKKV